MKPASAWKREIASLPENPRLTREMGRGGEPTLRLDRTYFHSRYNPREEAQRLLDSARLDPERPVFVAGLGLGYHVETLLDAGLDVAVAEPDPAVLKFALEGPLGGTEVLIGCGAPEDFAQEPAFQAFARRIPQVLVHPPTMRVHPGYEQSLVRELTSAAFAHQPLGVAVVGPMFGGSLPIGRYLTQAFEKLGHRARFIDNSKAWPLYQASAMGLETPRNRKEAGQLLEGFLHEWTLARVREFAADVCIVLAQAPVRPEFAETLAEDGIVPAFWFVENWRHATYWRHIAPRYDYFFHIQPGSFEEQLTGCGCRHHAFVQTACDPEEHYPIELDADEQERFGCGVSFAGAGYFNRHQVFLGLTDHDFKIWGVDWTPAELQPLVQDADKRFDPEKFRRIVAGSKISINLHASTTYPGIDPNADALNPRVFEIAACGGFQLCDPCKGLERHFDLDAEIPTYRSLKQLREQIAYYLANPDERRAIAERARERVLRDHTYEHRAQQMLDLLFEAHGRRILRKGVRIQRTCGEMVEQVGRESELGILLARVPADTPFTLEHVARELTNLNEPYGTYPIRLFAYLLELKKTGDALVAARA